MKKVIFVGLIVLSSVAVGAEWWEAAYTADIPECDVQVDGETDEHVYNWYSEFEGE